MRRVRPEALLAGLAGLVALAALGCGAFVKPNPDPWVADFEALKTHMSAVYANLEWVVAERGVDPYRANQEALAALQSARSRGAAQKAIERFVEAFGDPHFSVRKASAPTSDDDSTGPLRTATLSAHDACKAIGFKNRDLDFKLPFHRLETFGYMLPRPSANPFPAGMLLLPDRRRVGFVRIAEFQETCYPGVAESLWDDFRTSIGDACDGDCQWTFRLRVAEQLLGYIAEWAHVLRDAGAEALVVDITDNGGGTDWAGIAPRVLTRRHLDCPQSGFIKHPHATQRIEQELQRIDEQRNRVAESMAARQLLDRAAAVLQEQLQAANPPCDRTLLFEQPNAKLPCTQIVRRSNCGVLDADEAAAAESMASSLDPPTRGTLFSPYEWTYERGAWDGPLFVLVDRNTASASEQFATLLQANNAAIVIGERTQGAGCGYTWGGVPISLENIGVEVWMPDCVRYRADGQNELAGVEPDIDIGWERKDGDMRRLRKLVAALEAQSFAP